MNVNESRIDEHLDEHDEEYAAFLARLEAREEAFYQWLIANIPDARQADVSDAYHGKSVQLTRSEVLALWRYRAGVE